MHNSAILLVNLGSPESPTTKHLKPYLTEFLMDERVIDMPLFWRNILVKGIIVPFRAPGSAAKYKSIWTADGSPLVSHTKEQCRLLQEKLDLPVYYSMRYGSPSTTDILRKIHADNPLLKDLIVFPLYPHYAMSSYETAVEQVKQLHKSKNYSSGLHIIQPFYDHPAYILAMSESIRPYLAQDFDHILFSYHGIPERHVRKTDCTGNHCLQSESCCEIASPAHAFCYRHQIIATTNRVAEQLGLQKRQFSFSFQSRLGRDPWLKPFTSRQLKYFPKAGIKKLLIVCPAFVSDCLETLEEIAMEGKEEFLQHGGEQFTMIPAMNENQEWINCMQVLIRQQKLLTPLRSLRSLSEESSE
jgi:protoporphyrin/coproporphyrin ferrochelatase